LRLLIFILSCLNWTFTQAQKCETHYGRTINCFDKDSLKQGFWYEYKIHKILTTDSFNKNPKAIGFHNEEGKVETPIGEGYYKDNNRVGKWTIYVGSFYNDIYPPTSHTRQVTYTDTGYILVVDTFWNFAATLSTDSSSLHGIVTLTSDKVDIHCKNKMCYYDDPMNNNKRKKIPFQDIDDILYRLNYYDKQNKKK